MKKVIGSFLKIGAIGFGGGSALIPVVENEVVHKKKYVEKNACDEQVIISNITPGALPVKLGMLSGFEMAGVRGMLAGAFCVALPGTLLTVGLLSLLGTLGRGAVEKIEFASVGISAFIIFLLAEYICKVMRQAKQARFLKPALIIMLLSAALTCGKEIRLLLTQMFGENALWSGGALIDISTINLLILTFFVIFFTGGRIKSLRMLIAGFISMLYILAFGNIALLGGLASGWIQAAMLAAALIMAIRDARKEKGGAIGRFDAWAFLKQVGAFAAVLAVCAALAFALVGDMRVFLTRGIVSSVTSFGGGEAYLTVADGMFVSTGLVDSSVFYGQILPVANALPGPILVKILSGMGYVIGVQEGSVIGGYLTALLGLATGVCCTCITCLAVKAVYQMFSRLTVFDVLKQWILPVVCGLLCTTMLSMLSEMIKISGAVEMPPLGCMVLAGILIALSALLVKKCRVLDLGVIAAAGVLSILVFSLC